MKKLLFITNGHGEDLVAAEIIKGIQAEISVLPLVGEGRAFEGLNVKVLGARKSLPGGGFSLRNFWYLAKDVFSGLLGSTLGNYKTLKSLRGKVDLVVAVGDLVPIIGALIVKAPFIFVGVNKSSYYKTFGYSYTPWEKYLLEKYALKVYVRDQATVSALKSAEYVGNPLMDCVGQMTNVKCQMSNEGHIIIGFLPGTREHDVKLNLEDFNSISKEIKKQRQEIEFKVATKDNFSSVLSEATLIIGLSGTGNEQAAGSGIPVVSFYGRGSQYNKKFALAQKQLLGPSLLLLSERKPISVAAAVLQLINQPEKTKQMAKAGQERMGQAGACAKIAAYIEEKIK